MFLAVLATLHAWGMGQETQLPQHFTSGYEQGWRGSLSAIQQQTHTRDFGTSFILQINIYSYSSGSCSSYKTRKTILLGFFRYQPPCVMEISQHKAFPYNFKNLHQNMIKQNFPCLLLGRKWQMAALPSWSWPVKVCTVQAIIISTSHSLIKNLSFYREHRECTE